MINAEKITNVMNTDPDIAEGMKKYNEIDKKALQVSQEISKALIDNIVKDDAEKPDEYKQFNLTSAILAVSKSLIQLASMMYDSEEEFLLSTKHARELVVDKVIPSLLDPQPCGICDNCKNGKPEECINPELQSDDTQTRFLPILCGMLIEYDLFNKVLYMHTAGKNIGEELNTAEADTASVENHNNESEENN